MAAAVFFWVVLGLLVAANFKLVAWDHERGGASILVAGAAGGVLGGYLRPALFGVSDSPGFDPITMLVAMIASAILVLAYHRLIVRTQARSAVDIDQGRRAA
jgi:hypothetical protein